MNKWFISCAQDGPLRISVEEAWRHATKTLSAAPWKLESIWTKGQNYATKENVENVRRKTRETKLKDTIQREHCDLEKDSSMTPCLLGIMVTKSVDEAVRIERTSKLGSMRETIDLMKKVTGESLNYQRAR